MWPIYLKPTGVDAPSTTGIPELSLDSAAVLAASEASPSVSSLLPSLLSTLDKHLQSAFPNSNISLSTISSSLSLPPPLRTLSLVGASSGAYALLAAELTRLSIQLYRTIHTLNAVKRYDPPRMIDGRRRVSVRVRELDDTVWRTAGQMGARVVAVGLQVYTSMVPDSGFSGLFAPGTEGTLDGSRATSAPFAKPAEQIGHSAHLGGFLFGVVVMGVGDGLLQWGNN
ncbi:hypothetical protein HDU93_002665 [Gonapodya sp. JEL0774]|nr:hypothetical protein HDU93_002665 [Gonapodya sp. JEL0774]